MTCDSCRAEVEPTELRECPKCKGKFCARCAKPCQGCEVEDYTEGNY